MRPCFLTGRVVRDAPGVMHSIYIALPDDAADRLRELARRERRSPRQQAAVLVLAALESRGTRGRRQPGRDAARGRAAATDVPEVKP